MLGIVLGDFIREPAGGLTVAGQVVGGLIPGMDFRDIYANLKYGDLGMAAFSAIGLMPGVGDAVKSADTIIKFIAKNADNADEVVKILKIVGANWSEVAKLLGKSDEFKTAMKGMLTNPNIKYTKAQFDDLMDLLKKADLEELADEATNPDILRFLGKGGINSNDPSAYLQKALKNQGLEETPRRLKEAWREGDYKYTVRVHEGNSKYTDADSIYRVSRQSTILDEYGQGSGLEYLGTDGNWYHESVLTEFFRGGTPNPNFNEAAAKLTHIPISGGN